MPTVAELSAPYANFMLAPRHGPDVCAVCFNLTDGYGRCYACAHGGRSLDVVLPISYSVAGEQLHHALAGYKRLPQSVARGLALGLAAVLWRHLVTHERCVARAAGVTSFPVVTTVPSSDAARDRTHPLHELVGLVAPVRSRYERLLYRSDVAVEPHRFCPAKYEPLRGLDGQSVLLIDDMWTTGANAQSAAAALKSAGAGTVAAVPIGRYVTRDWHHNDRQLRALVSPFDWESCAACVTGGGGATRTEMHRNNDGSRRQVQGIDAHPGGYENPVGP